MQPDQDSAGLLHEVPLSWLCQLFEILTLVDKIALTKTSKWLARHAMQSYKSISIQLITGEDETRDRRSGLVSLLKGCQNLNIKTSASGRPSLPAFSEDISAHIRCINLNWESADCLEQSPMQSICNWSAFCNLHSFGLRFYLLGKDAVKVVSELCEILEGGALLQLHSFNLSNVPYGDLEDEFTAQLLARALDPKLKHLGTNINNLVEEVHLITNLESVEVDGFLTEKAMMRLCNHPAVHTVAPGDYCDFDKGNYRHCTCTWHTISIDHGRLGILSFLPYMSVKEVRILGRIDYSTWFEEKHCTLRDKLIKYGVHIVVEPVAGEFNVDVIETGSLFFVQQLRLPCRLNINGNVKFTTRLLELLQNFPPCVHSVHLVDSDGFDGWWSLLWKALPVTVTGFGLLYCRIPQAELHALLASTPTHVQQVLVEGSHADVLQHSSAAVVPAHVRLLLKSCNTSSDTSRR